MADKKISALLAATTPLAGTEVLPIVQSGATVKVSIADVTAGRAVSAASITLGTALAVPSGGTGATTLTGVVKGNGTSAFTAGTVALASEVTGTLPVANGGTGATTAGAARTSIGATTVGGNLFTLTNPSAITFPRFNADNTVSALDAATFRTAIGAGTGSGTVTSVALSGGSTGLTVSGSPITTSGTITLAGTLAVANGGTGVTTSTGTGSVVRSASPTLTGTVTIGSGSNLSILSPTVPATSSSSGVQGTISWDTSYIYICTSASTWKRVALSSF